jgi:hypothetical protein
MFEPDRSDGATKEPDQASEFARRAAVKPGIFNQRSSYIPQGPQDDALYRGDGSMEIPKNGREQGKGKVDS